MMIMILLMFFAFVDSKMPRLYSYPQDRHVEKIDKMAQLHDGSFAKFVMIHHN